MTRNRLLFITLLTLFSTKLLLSSELYWGDVKRKARYNEKAWLPGPDFMNPPKKSYRCPFDFSHSIRPLLSTTPKNLSGLKPGRLRKSLNDRPLVKKGQAPISDPKQSSAAAPIVNAFDAAYPIDSHSWLTDLK